MPGPFVWRERGLLNMNEIAVGRRGDACCAPAMSPPVFVVDTSVVAAGLITGSIDSPVVAVLDARLSGSLIYLVSPALLAEYRSVLLRPKRPELHGLTEVESDPYSLN